jgi:hypothetical protein
MLRGPFSLRWKCFVLACCIVVSLEASDIWGSTSQEQTTFDANDAQQITRPVPLPNSVLRILAEDKEVMACMKENPIQRRESLASWFIASEIHLNGPDEADLVALPMAQRSPLDCFHSVEGIGWFWVFRPVGARYQLVLKTAGLGLIIRDARHGGYRDIQTGAAFGTHSSQITYRFENGKYREYRRKAQ